MKQYKAFLFDLNGTMIDDMHYHVKAWHEILNKLGAAITMEEMKEQCYGKNDELLERIFPNRFTPEEKRKMSRAKEEAYQEAFKPQLKLIAGLNHVLEIAKQQQIRMAIGSAAIMFNIDFVIDNLQLRHYFDALASADDVQFSKPHPETYLKCAQLLGVSAGDCLVFEDAPKGVESALNAGMDAVVIKGIHSIDEFSQYSNICQYLNDYTTFTFEPISK